MKLEIRRFPTLTNELNAIQSKPLKATKKTEISDNAFTKETYFANTVSNSNTVLCSNTV